MTETAEDRAERYLQARRNATNSMHLARAVLGDDMLAHIFAKHMGKPNTAEVRALIVAEVSAAVVEKIKGVTHQSDGEPLSG